jgi:septal ring-binding cell division protein DamX
VPQKPENDNVIAISAEISQKIAARKKIDSISHGRWNLAQSLLIDIQAADEIERIVNETKPSLLNQIEVLKKKVEEEYAEEPETLTLLREGIPSYNSIRKWTLSEDWKKAVSDRVKNTKVFDLDSKMKVYDAILKKASISGDMKAAELYFKLSGELGNSSPKEPQEKLSKEEQEYKEFNNILRRK